MFAKKWALLVALVVIAAMVLPACAPPTPEKIVETVVVTKEVPVEVTRIVEKEATLPAGPTEPINIEVIVDGFGRLEGAAEWWQYISEAYHKEHPNITVSYGGAPRAWLQIQPRIVAGTPPDLVLMIELCPFHTLAAEGKLYPLDDILASPAYGAPDKSFMDTVISGLLDAAKVNGKIYMFPVGVGGYGWWYMPKLFEEHGWKKPYNGMTMDELYEIMDQIKADGFDVILHPGSEGWWAYAVTWYDLIQRFGGVKAWCACDNLEPGSYDSEAALKATAMMQEMASKYFPEDWVGLQWKESLNMMAQGEAAFWMSHTNCNANFLPFDPVGDFEFFRTPRVEGGKGDPTVMRLDNNWLFIPADAKHPEEAADLLKFMFSKENAARYVAYIGRGNAIKGSIADGAKLADEMGEPLPPGFISAVTAVETARLTRYGNFASYHTFEYETIDKAILALLRQQITPEEFSTTVQADADRIRGDASIMKLPKECPDVDW